MLSSQSPTKRGAPVIGKGACRDSHDKPASVANGMIRGIPESLHGWLKRQTERRRCSVNKAGIELPGIDLKEVLAPNHVRPIAS